MYEEYSELQDQSMKLVVRILFTLKNRIMKNWKYFVKKD